MILVCGGIFYHAGNWKIINDDGLFSVHTDIHSSLYKSEINIKNNKKYFIISGFCYKLNEPIKYFDVSVVLREVDQKEFIIIPTHLVVRRDISNKEGKTKRKGNFAMYDASGYETRISKNKLGYNKKFRVYLLYRNNGECTLIDMEKCIGS